MAIARPEKFRFPDQSTVRRNRVFLDARPPWYVGRISSTALKNHRHVRPPSRVPNFIVGFMCANSYIGASSCLLTTFRAFFPRFFFFFPSLFFRFSFLAALASLPRGFSRPYVPRASVWSCVRARVVLRHTWTLVKHCTRVFKGTPRAALPDPSFRCSFRDSPTQGFKF